MILTLFLALNILTAHQPFMSQESPIALPKPTLKRIYTEYPTDGNWVKIPEGTKNITFHVEAENTETVLFWLIPTGTQTWTERKLIGYDIRKDPTDRYFSLTWTIDKPYLHDHLHVQALGDEILEQDSINLSMD